MGRPKSGLEWHGATLLFRTAAVVARAVTGPVVVVRAPGQELPALPDGAETVEDPVEGLGPMQGIAAGLGHLRDRARGAFICSTDLPFLHPAYVRCVLRGLDDPAVGALASGPRTVPAASLGEAATAVDLALDRHVLPAVNGDHVVRDPRLPLVAGDTVAFRSTAAGD
jgi:molybdopterin-guanine dinucleotide biosynthesis protein A